jgi:proline iminopeptidase
MYRTPKPFLRYAVLLALLLLPVLSPAASAHELPSPLFPEIEPYESGYLRVSEIHEIYYEQLGNPQGKPVFFLHGGPGGSAGPGTRRFYDPKKFRIVLHDQRGAGRSRPFAELRENNTQNLVEDINRLRAHLKIEDKILLVGGSWGSTLALAYAEAHPERVAGMVLRGIYLGTPEEMESFYGDGVAAYFPEVSEKLWSQVPEMPGKTRPQRLLAQLESPDPEVRKRIARAWAAYEFKVAFLERSDAELDAELAAGDQTAFSRIENHYMANDCFLEPNQLLRDVQKIRHIPVVIINGRYDVICPPKTAYRLHKELPKSELWIVEAAGHAGSEPGIQAAIVRAVKTFE